MLMMFWTRRRRIWHYMIKGIWKMNGIVNGMMFMEDVNTLLMRYEI